MSTGGTTGGAMPTGGTTTGGVPTGGAATGGTTMSNGGTNAGGTAGRDGVGGCGAQRPPDGISCVKSWTVVVPSSCFEGSPTLESCKVVCGEATWMQCSTAPHDDGTTTVVCGPLCIEGRRPPCFRELGRQSSGVSGYFARVAALEAASVDAFRQLRAELRPHRAPRRLRAALSRAARDERRHARATRALMRRFGGASAQETNISSRRPSLEQLATENAVEGCVRETYGAAVALWQARNATDLTVRAAMQRIAKEELRHAALSLQLQRWLLRRLDRDARQRVAARRRRALDELRAELEIPYEPELAATVGLPSVAAARELYLALVSGVWGSARDVFDDEAAPLRTA